MIFYLLIAVNFFEKNIHQNDFLASRCIVCAANHLRGASYRSITDILGQSFSQIAYHRNQVTFKATFATCTQPMIVTEKRSRIDSSCRHELRKTSFSMEIWLRGSTTA